MDIRRMGVFFFGIWMIASLARGNFLSSNVGRAHFTKRKSARGGGRTIPDSLGASGAAAVPLFLIHSSLCYSLWGEEEEELYRLSAIGQNMREKEGGGSLYTSRN